MSKCKICGEEFSSQKESEELCFDCQFWQRLLEHDAKRPPHTVAIIDGTHYIIEPEDDGPKEFHGFGGDKFVIKFNDGTVVETTNLWCQGEPEGIWQEKFPNNANFDWEWKKIGDGQYLVPKK